VSQSVQGVIFGAKADGSAPAGVYGFLPMEKVRFGPGAVSQLPEEVARLNASRAFVVTGKTLAATPMIEQIRRLLGDRFAGLFSETTQHVQRPSVIAAADAARAADADILISFGGGSPNDTAKLVALSLAAGVRSAEELDRHRSDLGDDRAPVPGSSIPHIAIPTTLSAGEFTLWAGATDPERKMKDAYDAPHLTPRVVILDPELTRATPSWLWGSTGMRAMDHAVETVCSTAPQPFADALCLRAIEMLNEGLPRCVADPDDLTARGVCQVAAWMSIVSLPNVPAGLSHGMGHQLGAVCDVPHGVTSCILLPATLDFNRQANAERQALVAQALGVGAGSLDASSAAAAAADRLRELVRELGVKDRLSDWGVTDADLRQVADSAADDFMTAMNPRKVDGADQILEILRSVL
jgi:alcohol dehydrogenase class IV